MATVAAPIDATSTAAWKALEAHQEKLEAEGIDLKAWFAADAERVNKLSLCTRSASAAPQAWRSIPSASSFSG